jgi:hypothetical protein
MDNQYTLLMVQVVLFYELLNVIVVIHDKIMKMKMVMVIVFVVVVVAVLMVVQ